MQFASKGEHEIGRRKKGWLKTTALFTISIFESGFATRFM
jgi:hypothetical protein